MIFKNEVTRYKIAVLGGIMRLTSPQLHGAPGEMAYAASCALEVAASSRGTRFIPVTGSSKSPTCCSSKIAEFLYQRSGKENMDEKIVYN